MNALASMIAPRACEGLDKIVSTVLYIEDDFFCRELMKLNMQKIPTIKLITCNDGESGIRMATRIRPQVIFIDANLPDMEGYQVLRRINGLRELFHFKAIVLSALFMQYNTNDPQYSEFDEYVEKPITFKKLSVLLSD